MKDKTGKETFVETDLLYDFKDKKKGVEDWIVKIHDLDSFNKTIDNLI